MKNAGIIEKQSELKGWLQKLKLSQNEFAALFYDEIYDHNTPDDISKFQERFKKELNRESTKVEVINKYLEFLYSLEKFKEAGYIRPQSYSDKIFDQKSEEMLKELSSNLFEKFESQGFEE